jgi:hypothetical protein
MGKGRKGGKKKEDKEGKVLISLTKSIKNISS